MIQAWEIFWANVPWMVWNGFLALIPVPLAWLLLSRRHNALTHTTRNQLGRQMGLQQMGLQWWLGVILLLLFLPNSAYVLTDIIHFVDDVRVPDISDYGIIFVVIPQYFLFIALGFQCHVLVVMRWAKFCQQRWGINMPLTEISTNLVCAIGIYLGRFDRFNTWDIVTAPVSLLFRIGQHFTEFHFYGAVFVFFGIISVLYAIAKPLTKGCYLYYKAYTLDAAESRP